MNSSFLFNFLKKLENFPCTLVIFKCIQKLSCGYNLLNSQSFCKNDFQNLSRAIYYYHIKMAFQKISSQNFIISVHYIHYKKYNVKNF